MRVGPLAAVLGVALTGQGCGAPHPAIAPEALDRGAVVLSGGEFIHPEIRRRFVQLAGGADKRFVYVPTASSGIRLPSGFEYQPTDADTANPRDSRLAAELAALFEVSKFVILHTRSRATAGSREFLQVLRDADGVWLGGGNAGRLAAAYLGTPTEEALRAILRRGGVVGGNSAGAIIQGSFIVRGNPEKPVLMASGRTRGFGLLPGVAIDPHLLSQKREAELITVLDRYPDLLGIGLPDSAGVVVRGRRLEVIGDGRVAIYDNQRHGCCWYYWVARGESFDLGRHGLRP